MRRFLAVLLAAMVILLEAYPPSALAVQAAPYGLRFVRGQYGVDLFWKHPDGGSAATTVHYWTLWKNRPDGSEGLVGPDWRADSEEWHLAVALCETCTATYEVRADDSPYSNQVSVPAYSGGDPGCTIPAAPTITGTASGGTVTLTWSAVAGANSYAVYRNGTLVAGVSSTGWGGTYPVDGTNDVFTVTAVGDCGESPPSNSISSGDTGGGGDPGGGTCTAPPSPPTITGTYDATTQYVTLTWNPVPGAQWYNIKRYSNTVNGWEYETRGAVTGTSWSGQDAAGAKYVVTANNDCGESAHSNTFTCGDATDPNNCLCTLKGYLEAGAPIPQMPPMPPITRPPSTGTTVPPVATIPQPPDIPPPPALPEIPDPDDTPWGLPRDPVITPSAPGSPGGPLTPQLPKTPGGPLTSQTPMTPSAPGSPGGPLTPQLPKTPGGPLTSQTPMTPGGPIQAQPPMTAGGSMTPDAPVTPQGPLGRTPPLTPAGPGTPAAPMTPQPPMTPATP